MIWFTTCNKIVYVIPFLYFLGSCFKLVDFYITCEIPIKVLLEICSIFSDCNIFKLIFYSLFTVAVMMQSGCRNRVCLSPWHMSTFVLRTWLLYLHVPSILGELTKVIITLTTHICKLGTHCFLPEGSLTKLTCTKKVKTTYFLSCLFQREGNISNVCL